MMRFLLSRENDIRQRLLLNSGDTKPVDDFSGTELGNAAAEALIFAKVRRPESGDFSALLYRGRTRGEIGFLE